MWSLARQTVACSKKRAHARTCLRLNICWQAAMQSAPDDAQGAAAVERHLVHHKRLGPLACIGSCCPRQQRYALLHAHHTCVRLCIAVHVSRFTCSDDGWTTTRISLSSVYCGRTRSHALSCGMV